MEISSLHQTQIPPTFLAPTPLAKDIHHIIGSTMMASTIHTKIMNVSTVTGSTIQTNTLELNTILGSTIRADTLSVSTIVGSTIQTNTLIAPDLQGSTIQTNTSYYNALIGSTLSTTTLQVSSLTGSTIQTNTLGFFDTKVLLNVAGEYITFDLGISDMYYNLFQQVIFNGSNTTNRIHFLGSNDNTTWFSIGAPMPDNIPGTQITRNFIFTPCNYRYLRLIITEIEIMNQNTQEVLIAYSAVYTTTTYNNRPIYTKTFSPNLSLVRDFGSMYSFTMGGQYSPMIDGGYATYIGSLTTTADTGQIIPKKTAILALTTSTIQANVLQVSSFIASTIQTDVLQMSSIVGSTIQTDALTASTVFGSTMRGDIIEVSTLYASNATGSTIQANQMIFNTLLGSTIYTNTYNASTITTSTIQMNRFSIETLTLSGNTINIDGLDITTLTGSTIISNVVQVSTINVRSTLVGSTIQANVLNNNVIIGSTIQTGTLQVSTLSNSQNVGSTIQATQFTGTNIIGSTLQTNALQVSTIVGSTIQTQQFITSTILGSTIRMNLLNTSTIVCSTIQISVLDVSTIFGSTIQVSTIGMSTIIGSTIRNISYLTSTITGSTIQSNTLKASTIYGSSIIGSTIQTPYITVSTISSSTIIGSNLQANKIVITDGNNALTTSATNASQLQYITNLTSRVCGINQANEWNAVQTFSTSSIYFTGDLYADLASGAPYYSLGLNASNELVQTIISGISESITGTLSENYIPYASAVSTLSNSIIYRVNATDLAIGQTTSAFPTETGTTFSVAGLTQTTSLRATSGTFSKIFMADKRGGLNGTVISGNNGCNFYMGTMANTDTGNYTDTLYLNSWGDSSAGNVNAVMFRKSAIGMRIYQGAVGAASNFTTYQDAVMTDVNSGNITLGQNSDTNGITFGPNVTWSSYLKIGAGPNRSYSGGVAQCYVHNGDLYLESGTGNDIYINYYSHTGSGSCTTEMYGATKIVNQQIQQDLYAYPLVLCSNRICRSQALNRQIYRNNSVGWTGGVVLDYAFYKYNSYVSVNISGKLSYYVSGATRAYPYIRFYHYDTGNNWYHSLEAFTNNGYNHVTQFFELILVNSDLPYAGWYQIYVYNAGNCISDGNDQLQVNVTILPASGY